MKRKPRKPHFRVMVSVIEVGDGIKSVYQTEITSYSFAACRNFKQAENRAEFLIRTYESKWMKKSNPSR